MKNQLLSVVILAVGLISLKTDASAQATAFTVRVDQPTAEVQATMWGLFFEDINMGADGGVYAELVKNRSFEFDTPMMGWEELHGDSSAHRQRAHP